MIDDKRFDITGFEHLHRHSDNSLLDGYATVEEYAEYSASVNQKFLCITDHGMMGAIPSQIRECNKHDLKPIFGIEFYLNPDHPPMDTLEKYAAFTKQLNDEEKLKFRKSYHLLGIAYTNEGYKNLVKLSSWAHEYGLGGFPKRPRINHDILKKHKEGIIFTSCCYLSEIGQTFDKFGEDAAEDKLRQYMEMFGGNFYLELMMLDFNKQKPYDSWLIRMYDKYHVPVVLSQDCFVAGTLVLTDRGYKNIEDIAVGDLVLTHKNRFKKVEVIGSRKLREAESVFRVKCYMGSYSFDATENHKIYTASKDSKSSIWSFEWKSVGQLSKSDYLLVPKINPSHIFAQKNLEHLDIMDFIDDGEYQVGDDYNSSRSGNEGSRLQYLPESKQFISYRGWDRKCKTSIPRFLKVDDDLLKVIGLYMAEGWSDTNSHQVGFAFHKNEHDLAQFIVSYFERFNITSKIYKVSNKGIAVRFSSKIFNTVFLKLCGKGANNKHFPTIRGKWLNVWSRYQITRMLEFYWVGDGHGNVKLSRFSSTSKILIFEVAAILNALRFCCLPYVYESSANKNWKPTWNIALAESKTKALMECFKDNDIDNSFSYIDSHPSGVRYIDLGDYWAIKIKDIIKIEYDDIVYDFQVEDDHSFTANLWTSSNCHYCRKEDSMGQRLMLMTRTKNTVQDIQKALESGDAADKFFELQDTNLWMKSEDELNEKWIMDYSQIIPYEIYCEAKANTIKICEKASNVVIDRNIKLPRFPDADEKLWEKLTKGFHWRKLSGKREYMNRLRSEYDLICRKDFSSYFLITQMFTDEARRVSPEILGFGSGDLAVSPGRGSAVSFLTNYCLGITDVDPIKHDLLPERFLSDARAGRKLKLQFPTDPDEIRRR